MRTWRVGTISMGVALIGLGIFLLISQLYGYQVFRIYLAWWPVILVILGLEILLAFINSNKEHPIIRYDFLSILFVSVIGMVGILMTILMSAGVLQSVDGAFNSVEKTFTLPSASLKLSNQIKRVVVNGGDAHVSIEGTKASDIDVFGTYRTYVMTHGKKPTINKQDYLMSHVSGDTLYITIKGAPKQSGPFAKPTTFNVSIAVPNSIEFNLNANHQSVSLQADELKNNWVIKNGNGIDITLSKDSNVKIRANKVMQFESGDVQWHHQNHLKTSGDIKVGKGSHELDILDGQSVLVNVL